MSVGLEGLKLQLGLIIEPGNVVSLAICPLMKDSD